MQYCPKLAILSLTLNRSAFRLLGYGAGTTNDTKVKVFYSKTKLPDKKFYPVIKQPSKRQKNETYLPRSGGRTRTGVL